MNVHAAFIILERFFVSRDTPNRDIARASDAILTCVLSSFECSRHSASDDRESEKLGDSVSQSVR